MSWVECVLLTFNPYTFPTVMKILVTGAGGFIGSHLVEHCLEKGHTVRAFGHYNANNNWGWLETSPAKNEIEVVLGDIRDYDSVYAASESVDVILHLAALIGIPYSYVSPLAYVRTNVEGTYNVLEAARQRGQIEVVTTSTSETYGTAQYVPIDEKHPAVGQSPYAATKVAADQLAISYHRSFHLPVKIARPFNTYGPRQSARAIIPTLISQILSGARTIKLGNIHPTRDFTYVKDTAAGFLSILEAEGLYGEPTNIGMYKEITIGDLAALIIELIGEPVELVTDKDRVRPSTSEVERLYCDHRKIIAQTAWRPQYTLREGLQETIGWMKHRMHHYKPELYTV